MLTIRRATQSDSQTAFDIRLLAIRHQCVDAYTAEQIPGSPESGYSEVMELDALFEERFMRSASELNSGVEPASAALVATAMLHSQAVRARTGASREELTKVVHSAVDLICGPIP
ncbi:hypothetical protein PHLH4_35640 [Pseudomonas sp. St316]|nr:hypothetical protein PHLH4_35640 [Pseudomonas sp. St316]